MQSLHLVRLSNLRLSAEPELRTGKDSNLKTMRAVLPKPIAALAFCPMLVLSLCVGQGGRCYAQAQTQPDAPLKVAVLRGSSSDDTGAPKTTAQPAAKPDPDIALDIAKELAVMKARIEQLEAELKSRTATTAPAPESPQQAAAAPVATAKASEAAPSPATAVPPTQETRTGSPEKPAPTEPFAYADWTWLNGNARNKDAVWDSKFFTPEIRLDTDFVSSFNHPKDDTHRRVDRDFPLQRIPIGADQLRRRLPLARCSRQSFDHGWNVWRHDAAQRRQPGSRPMGPAWRIQLFL